MSVYGLLLGLQAFRCLAVRFDCSCIFGLYPSHCCDDVHAAIEGQGVALVGSVLVTDDLAAERLVRPIELSLPVNFAYYVVALEATADQPSIAAFREWIIGEASIESAAAT